MNRVLLVNDSKLERIVLKDLLDTLGYEVTSTDEYGMFELFDEYQPDLVIVNYIMEQHRGDELISELKSQAPYIKCVLSSSNSIDKTQLQEDIDSIIHTPITRFILQEKLNLMFSEDI